MTGKPSGSRGGHYLPGRRAWIKVKNRDYWRYPLEVATISMRLDLQEHQAAAAAS
ncbi:MAG TPA: hypothetical protein VFJ50_10770 [Gemmatimonadales bacterium]|nr:hypothetical protein [Gemmatimonadales bacterium]